MSHDACAAAHEADAWDNLGCVFDASAMAGFWGLWRPPVGGLATTGPQDIHLAASYMLPMQFERMSCILLLHFEMFLSLGHTNHAGPVLLHDRLAHITQHPVLHQSQCSRL